MSIAEKIEEIFTSPEKLSKESVDGLVKDSLLVLTDLKNRLVSEDEEVRKRALKDAEKMQAQLNEQMERMSQSLGIDPAQLSHYMAAAKSAVLSKKEGDDPSVFQDALNTLKTSVAGFAKQKRPKHVKEWLAT